MAARTDPLKIYNQKRDFSKTPEPKGAVAKKRGSLFIVQKHDARRLHFDFRLELDGVLKSWAVTKGPSLDPADKRLAVRTEDHPMDYAGFEGVIPEGYGAGTVILWDRGKWTPKGDPNEGLKKGSLKFELEGERLKGGFALVRMKSKKGEKRENWLLIKEKDEDADRLTDPTKKWTTSVKSGRDLKTMEKSGPSYVRGKTYKPGGGTNERKSAKAAPAKRPRFVAPQLATLRDAPPKGDGWLHEIKFDGYRMEALIHDGAARLMTRNEKDWTHRYRSVVEALANLDVSSAAIDGELVAIDDKGRCSFGALQNAEEKNGADLYFYAFDLLSLDGADLRTLPLRERKERLKPLIERAGDPLRFSDHIEGDGAKVIAKACSMKLEGIISKKADAPYRSGRGLSWIKSKCIGSDEFVVGGWRRSDKKGRPFSSLLLGEHVDGELHYRGRVGTGFDDKTLDRLSLLMKPLERKSSPFVALPADARRGAVFVAPKLVAQVNYLERTADGALRHPSFLGLRDDKGAKEVETPAAERKKQESEVGGVRLTSPDKILFEAQGATKRDLAAYYLDQAERILPFLKDRPLSLVRCPDGSGGECFFQKHHNASTPNEIATVDIESKDGKREAYLVVKDEKGLVAAAQIGALELHVWGVRRDRIERPERIIFDLDPDEGLDFGDVKHAAFEMRDVLESIGLQSFPMLTGGKGIHVIAPIERRTDWEGVKKFCRGLASSLAKAAPDRYVATMSKAKRKGKIFLDWLRNERGATAVAPYSPRARAGAPTATPVAWEELSKFDSANVYTIATIGKRLGALKKDPWEGYFSLRQSITTSMIDAVEG